MEFALIVVTLLLSAVVLVTFVASAAGVLITVVSAVVTAAVYTLQFVTFGYTSRLTLAWKKLAFKVWPTETIHLSNGTVYLFDSELAGFLVVGSVSLFALTGGIIWGALTHSQVLTPETIEACEAAFITVLQVLLVIVVLALVLGALACWLVALYVLLRAIVIGLYIAITITMFTGVYVLTNKRGFDYDKYAVWCDTVTDKVDMGAVKISAGVVIILPLIAVFFVNFAQIMHSI